MENDLLPVVLLKALINGLWNSQLIDFSKRLVRLVFLSLRKKKELIENECSTYGLKMFPAGLEPATFRV